MLDFYFNVGQASPAVDMLAVFGPQRPEDPHVLPQQDLVIGDGALPLVLKPTHLGRPCAVDGPASLTFDPPALVVATPDPADPAGLSFRIRDAGAAGGGDRDGLGGRPPGRRGGDQDVRLPAQRPPGRGGHRRRRLRRPGARRGPGQPVRRPGG